EGAVNEADPVLELRLLVLLRGLERTPEVVEDRNQFLDDAFGRTFAEGRLLTCAALAEVVELRREPLQTVEQLVPLRAESGELVGHLDRGRGNLPVPPTPLHWSAIADRRLRRRVDVLLRIVCHGYAFGASCSSSMTS